MVAELNGVAQKVNDYLDEPVFVSVDFLKKVLVLRLNSWGNQLDILLSGAVVDNSEGLLYSLV